MIADGAEGNLGEISFRQVSPFSPVLVNINVTNIPQGKHSVHIHAYGDNKDGCQSTGPHVRNILVGEDRIVVLQFTIVF